MWCLTWLDHLGELTVQIFYSLGDLLIYMETIDYENMVNLNITYIKR